MEGQTPFPPSPLPIRIQCLSSTTVSFQVVRGMWSGKVGRKVRLPERFSSPVPARMTLKVGGCGRGEPLILNEFPAASVTAILSETISLARGLTTIVPRRGGPKSSCFVSPAAAVKRFLSVEDSFLRVGGARLELDPFSREFVVGAGKAGAPMTRAAE